jgi:signal transduction histidine kinase
VSAIALAERPQAARRRAGSLRGRLTLTYTTALAVGLLVFAAFSLATIDQNLKNTLDARLAATVRAFSATARGRGVDVLSDPSIARRLRGDLGVDQEGAIVGGGRIVALQSGAIPSSVIPLARADERETTTFATIPDNGGLRVAAIHVAGARGGATLAVWRPLDVIGDYERIAVATLLGASLVIVLAAFVAGTVIVDRGLGPLRDMAAVASEIEGHDLTRRLGNDAWYAELREFASTFDRMLDRLEAAFARQRQFTADASHDLRAPLAVMRAETDLALARKRSPEEDRRTFASIQDEIREFDRLLEALLLSARADAEPIGTTPVDLVDLAARAGSRLESFARSRGVHIKNEVRAAPGIVGNAEILERVLASLLHNGVKFSPDNGTVSMFVRDGPSSVSLLIRDQGPGFSREALEFAFERFWKDDTARGRSGTGLGLAIAKSAVERIGGTIAIRNAEIGGAEVEATFPRGSP